MNEQKQRQESEEKQHNLNTQVVLLQFIWSLITDVVMIHRVVSELTFVFEVLQDGDDGFQRDTVSQEQLPGAVLLKGLPVQRLNCL